MRPPVQLFDLTAGLASPALPLFRARVSALRGPLVGIDVGTRHVGVAVSDDGRRVAFPALGFRRSDAAADRARMHRLLADRAAAGVLVGMPLLGRSAGKDSGSMKEFVEMYTRVVLEGVEVPVAFVDESYTTQMARMKVEEARPPALRRDARRRKEAMDAMAAAEILQCGLDMLAERVDG